MTLHFTWCLCYFETFYLLYYVNFTRCGPYNIDSTDVHSRVLLKICIFSEIDFMHFLGATGHPNHRWLLPSKFWKPSKNHWHQWLGPQKTFNGDGATLSKPLKNHWSQWWPEKNINHSIALKNWPSLWSNNHKSINPKSHVEDFLCDFLHSKLDQLESSHS